MPIRLLPPEVANRIAAGEVVERPASVVKELIENALDAGARRIQVDVAGGGLALIRVTDDGSGIAPDELDLAFRRHATSKLLSDDLASVVTLGFRGEALPSVAAVAEVEAISSVGANGGAYVRFRDGEAVESGVVGAPKGTRIEVRGLFRRQPARLKFLRSAAAEGSQIANVVSHYALAYPEAQFTLSLDGRESFATTGSGDGREAVAGVYGTALGAAMIEVTEAAEDRALKALISPPHLSRASRSYIAVFVNRRWVRSRSLTFAVEEAYRGLLQTGRFPIAVVDVRLPPADVDVNVHPAKAEVRLRNDREVFAFVQRPLRAALAGLAPPATSFEAGTWATTTTTVAPPPSLRLRPREAETALPPRPVEATATVQHQPALPSRLPILRPLGQAGTTYIIAEGPAGLYLIDQHAAHERVMFEKMKANREDGPSATQPLLTPAVLDLTPSQASLLASLAGALAGQGFEVEAFGGGYLLRSAPPLLRGEDPARAFTELLDLLTREDGPSDASDRVAASLACHAAVRAGQTLSVEEMRDLLRQLEECDLPQTCPHGRPTMLHLSADELARRFGRR